LEHELRGEREAEAESQRTDPEDGRQGETGEAGGDGRGNRGNESEGESVKEIFHFHLVCATLCNARATAPRTR
jgi:hypothetical protein